MKIYLFSGLGADERVFDRFKSTDEITFIALPWIACGKAKTLGDYAEMLIDHFDLHKISQGEEIAIGGVSLGGMIAQEIAARIPVKALVLISTITSRTEMPWVLRGASHSGISPLLRKPFLTRLAAVGDKLTRKSGKGRSLFYDMLQQADAELLHFGASAILAWNPPKLEIPIFRYHGSRDLVFPISGISPCHTIENGNHFMVFEKGETISRMIVADLLD